MHAEIEVGKIDASMTLEERQATAARFADQKSSMRVLITTYCCGATGLNLHTACSVMVPQDSQKSESS